ncbi:MAG TPA: hypothetical protein VGO49_11580 [Bradyrhizobium sp.]|jgi:hypothetical protein|nr:hypothetical protein [Bradyrhizobium sp.]
MRLFSTAILICGLIAATAASAQSTLTSQACPTVSQILDISKAAGVSPDAIEQARQSYIEQYGNPQKQLSQNDGSFLLIWGKVRKKNPIMTISLKTGSSGYLDISCSEETQQRTLKNPIGSRHENQR